VSLTRCRHIRKPEDAICINSVEGYDRSFLRNCLARVGPTRSRSINLIPGIAQISFRCDVKKLMTPQSFDITWGKADVRINPRRLCEPF